MSVKKKCFKCLKKINNVCCSWEHKKEIVQIECFDCCKIKELKKQISNNAYNSPSNDRQYEKITKWEQLSLF